MMSNLQMAQQKPALLVRPGLKHYSEIAQKSTNDQNYRWQNQQGGLMKQGSTA
jgi:hypothetical protein